MRLCSVLAFALAASTVITLGNPAWAGFPGKGDKLKWEEAVYAYNQGNIYFGSGSFDRAIEEYKKAIAIYPDDPEFFTYLGLSYKKKGDFPSAEVALRQSIALNGVLWDSWSNLGSVLKHQGKAAEAKDAYTRAVELNPPAKTRLLLQQNIYSLADQMRNTSPAAASSSALPVGKGTASVSLPTSSLSPSSVPQITPALTPQSAPNSEPQNTPASK